MEGALYELEEFFSFLILIFFNIYRNIIPSKIFIQWPLPFKWRAARCAHFALRSFAALYKG
jgi:hypothetical protein